MNCKLNSKSILIVLLSLTIACNKVPNTESTTSKKIEETALQTWQKMKFGLFIHWGVYSIPAGVWKGKQIEKLGEQIMRHADISIPDYENLAKQFNPVDFDADAIVALAKSAGMKYVILTSKHHDGFAMFKSEVSDYNIVDFTPYKKDILKELAVACKKHGLKLGLYYSTPDWHFNGPAPERNPVDGKISVFGKVSKENEDFQVAQLKELLTNYGEIVELFFDMGEPTTAQSKRFRETVKSLQPNCLINGRVMNNQGDFITMPDNHLPDVPIYDVAWETPGTFYHTWGYKSWVKGAPLEQQVKKQIRNLSKITCMGGNYLLNIGPKSDGTVVGYEQDVLKGIGKWTAIHKEAIFETSVNPFKKLEWGYSTVKPAQNLLYLHVFDWPKNGELRIPGLKNNINKTYHLSDTNKKELMFSAVGTDKIIKVGNQPSNANLSIVVVEYEGVLSIEDPILKENKKGVLLLKDADAIKHGKYGMLSYRSIIKDDHRTWDVEVEESAMYSIEMLYKMKYDFKEFTLETPEQTLNFSLSGKAPEKEIVEELFDGNETHHEQNISKTAYGKANIGTIQLKKGKQTIVLKSGQSFEFKATLKEFHAQDRKHRGLNADIKVIRLRKIEDVKK
ncbi:alpha-L-fucosidase [uncultured Polaribacter sp.]|uniref:alpha-L-fucosidase n=1 Tax=uncultured Polaribacter sp. TaxID=174711 RepID=UPI0026078127|nr:alpha-L-fucosidase [uncultured Polaribacter sp.]